MRGGLPQRSITVRGRDLFPEDLVDLPLYDQRAGYDSLQGLLLSRRSVRSFQEREVEPELVEKILHAASTAPMGLPPSEVGVLVFSGRARVKAFRDDLLKTLASWRWMTRPLVLTLMRPFLGKLNYEAFKEFVGPVIDAFIEKDRQGVDWFFYSAPLAIYFYASAWADPGDPYIAATYAMVAGQALGLGSCMLGFPGYAVRYDRKLRQKYRLPQAIQPGMVVIFGYPAVRYQRGILRRFAEVRYI